MQLFVGFIGGAPVGQLNVVLTGAPAPTPAKNAAASGASG